MHWFITRVRFKFSIYLECVFYTLVALGLCYYFSPKDPFLMQSPFPWLWLAPVIVSLRAGLGPGLISFLIILSAFIAIESFQALELYYQRLYLLGGLILTVICGEAKSSWSNRFRQTTLLSQYAAHQLEYTLQSYFLLQQSHDHLEKQLIMRPYTLRSAISDLRQLIRDCQGNVSHEQVERLVRILCHYCNIEKCAYFRYAENSFKLKPYVSHHFSEKLDINEPLIAEAIKSQQAMYHAQLKDPELANTPYIIAIPLVDSKERWQGMFVVKEMPFFAYQPENFKFMQVVLQYFVNSLDIESDTKDVISDFPDCPAEFVRELQRMRLIYKQQRISSHIAVIRIKDDPRRVAIVKELQRSHRGLDLQWVKKEKECDIILTIMPFSNYTDIVGFRKRIKRWMEQDFQIDFSSDVVTFMPIKITSDNGPKVILNQALTGAL